MKQQYEDLLAFIEEEGEVETYSIAYEFDLTVSRTNELLDNMLKVGLIEAEVATLKVRAEPIGETRIWRTA